MDLRISIPIADFEFARLRKRELRRLSNPNSKIDNPKFSYRLRELEAFASALLPILLPFLDARVARDQAGLLQRGTQVGIVFEQRARNAVANRARLSRRSAAADINQNVKLARLSPSTAAAAG